MPNKYPMKYAVWYPTPNSVECSWWEMRLSAAETLNLFRHEVEYFTQSTVPDLSGSWAKRIAVIRFESIRTNLTEHWHTDMLDNVDLSNFDLVIVYSTEPMMQPWQYVVSNAQEQLKTDKIVWFIGGCSSDNVPPTEQNFYFQNSFFSMVSSVNENLNHIHKNKRPYHFDCLFGTDKPNRLYLLYKLFLSGLSNGCLINVQPATNCIDYQEFNLRCKEFIDQYGFINDYSSEGLIGLEEPVIREFKERAKTPHERYSARCVPHDIFGQVSMSSIVPWTIYQNSWYSVVCETQFTGPSMMFFTEKTAKCFFGRRIFLMCNTYRSLHHLREMGYKTFHGDYIDESYDEEPDDYRRWEMVYQQMLALTQRDPNEVQKGLLSTLDHNQQVITQYARKSLSNIQDIIFHHLEC